MVIRKYLYGVTFDKLKFSNALKMARGDVALPENFRGYMFLVGMLGFMGTTVFLVVRVSRARYRRKVAT